MSWAVPLTLHTSHLIDFVTEPVETAGTGEATFVLVVWFALAFTTTTGRGGGGSTDSPGVVVNLDGNTIRPAVDLIFFVAFFFTTDGNEGVAATVPATAAASFWFFLVLRTAAATAAENFFGLKTERRRCRIGARTTTFDDGIGGLDLWGDVTGVDFLFAIRCVWLFDDLPFIFDLLAAFFVNDLGCCEANTHRYWFRRRIYLNANNKSICNEYGVGACSRTLCYRIFMPTGRDLHPFLNSIKTLDKTLTTQLQLKTTI